VRSRLELQVPLVRVRRVVGSQRAIYVPGMSVVTFDEVRVVAIHRANQVANGLPHNGVQPAGKLTGFPREVEG
jgi:hypothetical protein